MAESTHSSQTTRKPDRQTGEFDLSEMQPWREYAVILHDDEEHSPTEVVLQLGKALAWALTANRDQPVQNLKDTLVQ